MSIFYKLEKMEEIPQNCLECTAEFCPLPIKRNKYESEIKTQYRQKRHKDCPLREIDEK